MVRRIAPLFFTTDIPAVLAYYKDKLGFEWSNIPMPLSTQPASHPSPTRGRKGS
jgi:hypothetical protein